MSDRIKPWRNRDKKHWQKKQKWGRKGKKPEVKEPEPPSVREILEDVKESV